MFNLLVSYQIVLLCSFVITQITVKSPALVYGFIMYFQVHLTSKAPGALVTSVLDILVYYPSVSA